MKHNILKYNNIHVAPLQILFLSLEVGFKTSPVGPSQSVFSKPHIHPIEDWMQDRPQEVCRRPAKPNVTVHLMHGMKTLVYLLIVNINILRRAFTQTIDLFYFTFAQSSNATSYSASQGQRGCNVVSTLPLITEWGYLTAIQTIGNGAMDNVCYRNKSMRI